MDISWLPCHPKLWPPHPPPPRRPPPARPGPDPSARCMRLAPQMLNTRALNLETIAPWYSQPNRARLTRGLTRPRELSCGVSRGGPFAREENDIWRVLLWGDGCVCHDARSLTPANPIWWIRRVRVLHPNKVLCLKSDLSAIAPGTPRPSRASFTLHASQMRRRPDQCMGAASPTTTQSPLTFQFHWGCVNLKTPCHVFW